MKRTRLLIMKIVFGVCLLAVIALFAFQGGTTPKGGPTPVYGPTPIIEPLRIAPSDSKLTVLNPSQVLLVNMIARDQSDEQGQDSEPFLAVNNDDESLMIGAAFRGKYQPTGAVPLVLLSSDGGLTWKLRSLLPAQQIGAHTYCFSGKGKSFYGSVMTIGAAEQTVSVFHADDPATDQPLTNISTLSSASQGDAPFIQARAFGPAPTSEGEPDTRIDKIFVGQNYFGFSGPQKARTASIRVSVDDGKTFRLLGLEARDTGEAGQDGPAVRPAIAIDGTVYVAFLHWSSKEGSRFRGDVVVTRDDQAAAGDNPFRALVDSDGLPGRTVTRGSLFSSEKLGKQRIVSPLSLAVDPHQSAIVYVAWGDYDASKKNHVLHLKRSTDKGQNWSDDLLPILSATNPALAVSDEGVVGFLYQRLTARTAKRSEQWETHFRSSKDGGANWTDIPLAIFPTAIEPKSESDPYLGYRSHLLAIKSRFYGIFSAPNTPNQTYFPQGVSFQRNYDSGHLLSNDGREVSTSIDPFFFRIAATNGAVLPKTPGANSSDASSGTLSPVWRFGVPIAVVLGVVLSALGIVEFSRARRLSLTTNEQIRTTNEERHGPALINYSGYVAVRFEDLKGEPITEIKPGTRCKLRVQFSDQSPVGPWVGGIDIGGGEDKPEVNFTVAIDTDAFKVDSDHSMVSVPAKGSRDVTFPLVAIESAEEHSLFVQVFQWTHLVQVVKATLLVSRD